MMNKLQAKTIVKKLLHNHFSYIFTEQAIDLLTLHLTFKMDSGTHSLQMSLSFQDNYCDILTFISPTVLKDESAYIDTLKTVNEINWNTKAFGRFYIDDQNDIAYSLRMNYLFLEEMPDLFLYQITTAVKYYEDLFCLIIEVASGKKSYEYCRDFLNKMWG